MDSIGILPGFLDHSDLDHGLVMTNYVFLFFLPGGAGHFVARALNLVSDQHYCLITDPDSLNLPLEQRHAMLGYKAAQGCKNWNEFEKQIRHYSDLVPYHNIPPDSYSIWLSHPNYDLLDRGIAGPDDQVFKFYIDPDQDLEWCLLNALYKDAHIARDWMAAGKIMRGDPDIHNISLSRIIHSADTFLDEILKVCDITGAGPAARNIELMLDLWHQWHATTLTKSRFDSFKNDIGWDIT